MPKFKDWVCFWRQPQFRPDRLGSVDHDTNPSQESKKPPLENWRGTSFGKDMKPEFLFGPDWRNLNHGSFGSIPRAIQSCQRAYQDQAEASPDPFIRTTYPALLDVSRAAAARLLGAPPDTVVFVPNATTAVNTVLRSLVWAPDGHRDAILHFSTAYGACRKTIDCVVATSGAKVCSRAIDLSYPLTEAEVLARFDAAVSSCRQADLRPRVCMFDAISSQPGVRFPFEVVTAACRREGILSLIDGAHAIGQVPLDLAALDPDFFTSNCHKWLHVPRGCAVLYVPVRNQYMIRSTLPTSWGYIPSVVAGNDDGKDSSSNSSRGRNALYHDSAKSAFATNFQFAGTIDVSPYLCVADAIRWREEVLGGEERIMNYCHDLNKRGSRRVAEILRTQVLDTPTGSLTDCMMACVALPLEPDALEKMAANAAPSSNGVDTAIRWIERAFVDEYKTYIALFRHAGRLWARISAQVYLDMDDYEWAATRLRDVCERVMRGEHYVLSSGTG